MRSVYLSASDKTSLLKSVDGLHDTVTKSMEQFQSVKERIQATQDNLIAAGKALNEIKDQLSSDERGPRVHTQVLFNRARSCVESAFTLVFPGAGFKGFEEDEDEDEHAE
ncbi:hypothetical protein N7486_010286 [Penicillium sp. IBT 16267x]|nr:hypothetical protein N7486_010286 [Penicillium sp. IBT 16267x]